MLQEHDFVDFGIEGMPLWATCNLGASSPEQRGDRYAWGETETKDKFKDSNYTKKGKYNKRDGKTQLDLEDDAARVQWGGKWQMPTAADFDLLSKKCKLEKATVNGKNGMLVSHNGKSIFLPELPSGLAYWTASPLAGSEDEAISATAYGDYIRLSGGLEMRYKGYFIRPIMRKCDLGESVKPQPAAQNEEPKKDDNKADNKDAVVYVSYTSEEGDNCAYLFIVVNRKFYWVDENYNVAEPIDEKLMNSYIQGCERGDYEEWDETLDSYDSIEEFLEAVGEAKKEVVEDEGECMSENGEYTVTMFVGDKKVCEKVVS